MRLAHLLLSGAFLCGAPLAWAIDTQIDEALGNSPLTVNNGNTLNYDGLVVGTSLQLGGGLVNQNAGTLNANRLTVGSTGHGAYTMQGGSSNTSGAVAVGTNGSGTLGFVNQSGGNFTAGSVAVGVSNLSLNSYYLLTSGTFTFGSFSGTGFAQDVNFNKLRLSGGAGNVSGQLALTNAGVLLNGGTLNVGSVAGSGLAALTVSDPNGSTSALAIGVGSASSTLTATVQNGGSPGGFTKIGTGTLTIARVQPFTGPTRVQSGTLLLDNTSNLSSILNPASAITVTNATLHLQGAEFNVILPDSLTVGVGGVVEAGNSTHNAHTIGALVLQGGTLTNTAPADPTYGNFVIKSTGSISASGGVTSTISAAVLQFDTMRPVDVAAGSTLAISSQIPNHSGGTVAGGINKTGPGILSFTGTSTYTSGTTVSGGLLRNNGTMAGPVAVASGGTVGGTGTFGGPVSLSSGGTLAPGNAAVGTLAVGSLSLAAGSLGTFEFKTGANDFVSVTASNGLTVSGGALTLYAEGSTTAFGTLGAYDLFGYVGTLGGAVANLSVANPVAGRTYVFSNDTARHRVVLTISGTAPAFTSANNATFQTGVAGAFTVTTSGFPFPPITRSGTLPTGVTFVDNGNGTGTLSGTPGPTTGGAYVQTFNASNPLGSAPAQTFTLTVNQAPAITSANATTFAVGSAGSFTVTGTGYPAPTFSLTGGTLPSGVTLVGGTLSGTPAVGTGGVRTLTFSASNGVGSPATQSFTLSVNEKPTITSAASATFQTGQAGTFTITSNGLPAATISQTGTLPAGVTFTNNGNGTATLGGTPGAAAGAFYPLTINAQNASGTATPQSFSLTVNQPAAITSAAAATFTVGTAGSFSITRSGYPASTVTLTGGTLPGGLTLNAGVLSGTPVAGTGGVRTLTFSASNGIGAPGTQSFTLSINEAPVLTAGGPPPASASAGDAYQSYTFTASGYPAPTFAVQAGSLPPGLVLDPNGTLYGTPTTPGSFPGIQVRGTNAAGFADTATFSITVIQLFASQTTLVTNSVDATQGDPVTFTATVLPNQTGAPATVAGLVQFFDGNTPILSAESGSSIRPLDANGRATCTTGALTAAASPHAIRAEYLGDLANFRPSTGTLSQRIVTFSNCSAVVTSLADSGPGSLRAALASLCAGGTITFSLPAGPQIIELTTDELLLSKNVKVTGPGAGQLTVRRSSVAGTPEFRIFHSVPAIVARLSGLTLSGGSAISTDGGGILVDSSNLTVSDCTITGNAGGLGGGLCVYTSFGSVEARLRIERCTVTQNTGGYGGGIVTFSGDVAPTFLVVTDSTIDHNYADQGGGYCLLGNSGHPASVLFTNSTLHGNTAAGAASGLYLRGNPACQITLLNSTVAGNAATGPGLVPGIRIEGGNLMLQNSLLADNVNQSYPVYEIYFFGGTITGSYNLVDSSLGFTFGAGSSQNIVGVDAKLQKDGNGIPVLQNNGGPTKTVLPLPASPGIDQGRNAVVDASGNAVLRDQRGQLRPAFYYPSGTVPPGGDGSDIGAVELPAPALTPSESWRLQYFGSTANSGAGADANDPEGDGLSNLVEFATGTNPTQPNVRPGIVALAGGNTVTLSYDRAKAAVTDGVLFQVEWKDDLSVTGTWSTVGVTETAVVDTTVDHVTATVTRGPSGQRFLRLRVTRP